MVTQQLSIENLPSNPSAATNTANEPGVSTSASSASPSFSLDNMNLVYVVGLIGIVLFAATGISMLFAAHKPALATDYKPMLVGLFFLGSVQLAFIGIIGEYVFKGYKEAQNRPMYFVRNEYLD